MNNNKEIKVGDLVKCSYDSTGHMVYLVGAVEEPIEGERYATLIGHGGAFGIASTTDGVQQFNVRWLELVKSASR
tara:strand:- start:152 stop:376 length:225 start_codon:yes stop_codon:yes gene_type:complete